LRNDICAELKLDDFKVLCSADYISAITFVISSKLSEEHAHFDNKSLAASRFIGAARQQPETKENIIHRSVLQHIQGFREDKTAYGTKYFGKICQFT
jgi:hypothetical protein